MRWPGERERGRDRDRDRKRAKESACRSAPTIRHVYNVCADLKLPAVESVAIPMDFQPG